MTESTSGATRKSHETLRSVHTTTFPQLLEQLGISLLVSTYQAGKVIVVRAQDGVLNTHFRNFESPMGLAYEGGRLGIATKWHVWEYHNLPAVAAKLEPAGRHDACFLPRASHVTGDIRVHEIAWATFPPAPGGRGGGREGIELWIVNTRFSCLCTLDRLHSFVPRWQPPFVSELTPEDRCHLNGLAVLDGRPQYVTCLGQTDTASGWRTNKARGGCLLDIPSGAVLLDGLSMPHSPRFYNHQLWLLESGLGTLARIDPFTGTLNAVAELPGFTRGLDFRGQYAFIGLSQVRESAAFSGIPLTERLQERTCGVWVVDVSNGQTVAFLRFESGVQEIFAVQVLPGIRFPEVTTDDPELLANSFVLPDA